MDAAHRTTAYRPNQWCGRTVSYHKVSDDEDKDDDKRRLIMLVVV